MGDTNTDVDLGANTLVPVERDDGSEFPDAAGPHTHGHRMSGDILVGIGGDSGRQGFGTRSQLSQLALQIVGCGIIFVIGFARFAVALGVCVCVCVCMCVCVRVR